eukprot:4355-Heterococcus_DN1.PRE.3
MSSHTLTHNDCKARLLVRKQHWLHKTHKASALIKVSTDSNISKGTPETQAVSAASSSCSHTHTPYSRLYISTATAAITTSTTAIITATAAVAAVAAQQPCRRLYAT